MTQVRSAHEYVRIGYAAEVLGVTEQTLRNWDKQGRLPAYRHPVNGYRLYRTTDLSRLLKELRAVDGRAARPSLRVVAQGDGDYEPCHWSPEVALDPKHRPQSWASPATTVRRDWRKFPQEAHVLSEDGRLYRRLSVEEIALLQGFDPGRFESLPLTTREKIAVLGDAVPPPVARALVQAIVDTVSLENRTAVEICAGAGGLAEGSARAGLEHLGLIEMSSPAVQVLERSPMWSADQVHCADVRSFDFRLWRNEVGVLSGGPPCQPWSQAGQRKGALDERDLMGWVPELVGQLAPEAFLFENVPGLLSDANRSYLGDVVQRLRDAAGERSYAVLVAKLNAADFGVPQVRQRIFLLGLRGGRTSDVARCFDAVYTRRTHAPGGDALARRLPWATVGDVLGNRPDPGGWRRWIGG